MFLCAIWYHLNNFKNVKNTHGEVLLLVRLQALACNFTKSATPPSVFFRFLNCTNDTKSRNASQIISVCKLGLSKRPWYIFSTSRLTSFRTHSNVFDGTFSDNLNLIKKLNLRCLAGFQMCLCS